MAVRLSEEEIPEAGDYVVYEIATLSFIVMRQADGSIKAFPNACLHRGRKLKDHDGHCSEMRCSFHSFAWTLDGELKDVPARWDLPHIDEGGFHLPELKVATWAGCVFVNPDPDATAFADFISGLAGHFAIWDLGNAYTEARVCKVIHANWAITQKAFYEAYHVSGTHPQILRYLEDTNSQVDLWDNFVRVIAPSGTPSPELNYEVSQNEMMQAMLDVREGNDSPVTLAEGQSMRAIAAQMGRNRWRSVVGDKVDHMSDADLRDSLDYTPLPTFHP